MNENMTLKDLVENGFAIYKGMVSIRKLMNPRANQLPYLVTTKGAIGKRYFDTLENALEHIQSFEADDHEQE